MIATFANRFVNLRDFSLPLLAETHLLSWIRRLPKCSLHVQYLHNDSDLCVPRLMDEKQITLLPSYVQTHVSVEPSTSSFYAIFGGQEKDKDNFANCGKWTHQLGLADSTLWRK